MPVQKKSGNLLKASRIFEGHFFSHVGHLSLVECNEMYVAVRVRKTGTRYAERQNRIGKKSQTIYASMLHVLSCVSLAGKAKNERVSYRKGRIYIVIMPRDRLQTRFILCETKSNP